MILLHTLLHDMYMQQNKNILHTYMYGEDHMYFYKYE